MKVKVSKVDESNINDFYQKNFVHGNWAILGPKVDQLLEEFFEKSCVVKGANRYMEIILMAFLEKCLFVANEPFRTQNGASS